MSDGDQLSSEMGWSTPTQVFVRGHDLCADLLGHINLGDMAFLEITGRRPNSKESVVFNAMLCTLVEHGLTPSAIAARMTYLGAPEALQAAVASGLCGMGTHFAGTAEGAARMLQDAVASRPELPPPSLAATVVATFLRDGKPIPGLGHPVHKPLDPRATALFDLAEQNGLSGHYVALMRAVSLEAEQQTGKAGRLPVNATGAIAALACELGIPWQLCRGLAVIGRSVGLVGHISEEIRKPLAEELWLRTEAELSRNRQTEAKE